MACVIKEQCIRKIKNRLKLYGAITIGAVCVSMLSCKADESNKNEAIKTVSSNSIEADGNTDSIKDINIL